MQLPAFESGLFANCSYLKSVIVSDNIISIGEGAFWGCTSLKSMEIPEGVIFICQMAFYGCDGLLEVIIPESVISIGTYAFYGCTELSNLIIPRNAKYFGDSIVDTGKTVIYVYKDSYAEQWYRDYGLESFIHKLP